MNRMHELERDRQVAELREVLRISAEQAADDGEVESRTLDGFGDGFEPPRAAWRARLAHQRGSVAVFVVVAVLAAAATVLVTWLLRPTPTPVPAAGEPVSAADEHADVAAQNAPQDAQPSPDAVVDTVVVAVVGQVAAPGLVTLPEGARVSDAIAAAGGPLPGTDLTAINIARRVTDGEQIAVGVPAAADAATGDDQAPGPGKGRINLNSATVQQLDELPGVGPVTAQSIVDFREQNGPFGAVAELVNVSGIGPATMAKLADLVTV